MIRLTQLLVNFLSSEILVDFEFVRFLGIVAVWRRFLRVTGLPSFGPFDDDRYRIVVVVVGVNSVRRIDNGLLSAA